MTQYILSTPILHLRPNTLFPFAVLAAALVLGAAAPAVLAAINCPGGGCQGTDDGERLQGTAVRDVITGKGGSDTISGRGANDTLYGDDQSDPALDGADRISGGGGDDLLRGFGGADLLVGGPGNDTINAEEGQTLGHPPGKDTVRGSRGNDAIYAADGVKDKIDCGPGRDYVLFDGDLDTVTSCEDKDAT